MGTVHTVFTSDDRDLVKALERQQSEVVKLREENKKLGRGQRQQASQFGRAVQGQVNQLKNMVTGLFGVQKAVEFVRAAYQSWDRDMDQLAKRSENVSRNLVRDLIEAGDLASLTRIRTFLEQQPATREQGRAAFAGVTGAAQFESLERRLELTRATLGLAPAGIDLGRFGELVGELGETLPEKAGGDVADLAIAVQQAAGRNIGEVQSRQFQSLVGLLRSEAGVDAETALSLGIEAFQKNVQPRALQTVAGRIGADFSDDVAKLESLSRRRELTAAEQAKLEFGRAGRAERLELLSGDQLTRQVILGLDQAARFGRLDLGAVRERAETFRQAQTGDRAAMEILRLQQDEAGRQQLRDFQVQVLEDRAARDLEAQARERGRAERFAEASTLDDPLIERAARRGFFHFFRAVGESVGAEDASGTASVFLGPTATQQLLTVEQGQNALRNMEANTKRTADALERIEGGARANAAARDADRHTE